jgi:hypothetical protein
MLEFLATNADGTRRPIEVATQRAKNMALISDRAKTIMRNAALRGSSADICIIKDQMGHVLGQVSELASTLAPSSQLLPA